MQYTHISTPYVEGEIFCQVWAFTQEGPLYLTGNLKRITEILSALEPHHGVVKEYLSLRGRKHTYKYISLFGQGASHSPGLLNTLSLNKVNLPGTNQSRYQLWLGCKHLHTWRRMPSKYLSKVLPYARKLQLEKQQEEDNLPF